MGFLRFACYSDDGIAIVSGRIELGVGQNRGLFRQFVKVKFALIPCRSISDIHFFYWTEAIQAEARNSPL